MARRPMLLVAGSGRVFQGDAWRPKYGTRVITARGTRGAERLDGRRDECTRAQEWYPRVTRSHSARRSRAAAFTASRVLAFGNW